MKVCFAFLLLAVTAVIAYPTNDQEEDPEWVMIPDVEGNFYPVSMEEVKFEAALANRGKTKAKFLVYTRQDKTKAHEIVLNDAASVKNSHFDAKHPTRFVIHGWNGDSNANINTLLRAAYLDRGEYNVIVVDWSSGAKTINYIAARNNVNEAGEQVAAMVDFLHEKHGLSFDTTYIIGHSLGAHVSGMAGKHVKHGRIHAIFGLDPAFPLFSINKPNERLATGDALYVESIHTNGGKLGFEQPIGDSSFYPNWGKKQPGCGVDLTGSCSHGRSVEYFAESLRGKNEFLGKDCGSFDEIKEKKCVSRGAAEDMGGDPAHTGIRGVYYVPVHDKYPFATGKA